MISIRERLLSGKVHKFLRHGRVKRSPCGRDFREEPDALVTVGILLNPPKINARQFRRVRLVKIDKD